MKEKKKKQGFLILKLVYIIFYIILGWTVLFPLMAAAIVYSILFNKRVGYTKQIQTVDDYKNIMTAENILVDAKKHKLFGYILRPIQGEKKDAVMILSHGIGCTHGNYLNRAQYFVRKGYTVVVFDMSGSGASGGKNIKGLPHSVVDLHYVYEFVEKYPEFKNYKKLVYGHSWSGYASAAFLNYGHKPDAVVSMSGFNSSVESAENQSEGFVGKLAFLASPYIKLYERMLFGPVAGFSGIQGVNKYNGHVLIGHSKDDPTVDYNISVCARQAECTNKNAKFIIYTDRGHTLSRPVEVERKIEESLEGKPREKNVDKECIF